MQLHLVDGTFELFRAHFGGYRITNSTGMEIGATRGLMRSLVSLIKDDGATHIAVAFDHVVESFRNTLFAGYKTGEGMDPDLYAQFPLAEDAVRAMGITVWPMVEFEADDALATAAVRYAEDPRVERVILCSPDKDLCQVVCGERIVTLDRIRKRLLDEEGVHEKFGVAPSQIPDLLALVGDKADGIPGIPRWGMKSTAQVLRTYGEIEAIPGDPDQWAVAVRGKKTLADNLVRERDNALLYKQLTTARRDVPLTETVDDLFWQGANRQALDALIPVLGKSQSLERLGRWQS